MMPRVPHVAAPASPEEIGKALATSGAVIVHGLLGRSRVRALRRDLKGLLEAAPWGENDFDGYATRRVFDPMAQTRELDGLVTNSVVLDVVQEMIGPAQFGMTVLSEIGPGEVAQRPHRDGNVYPLPLRSPAFMVNSIWALDDFTETNGATLIAPGSHRSTAPARAADVPGPDFVPAVMEAGSVLLYDGRLVHGAGANRGPSARCGLIVEYVSRWLRSNENHTLAVPPEQAFSLPGQLQELLGYGQVSPYFGFVAAQAPQEWLAARFVGGTPSASPSLVVRPATRADRPWISEVLTDRWGAPRIVSRGVVHDAARLPALVAEGAESAESAERTEDTGDRLGLLTYRQEGGDLEIVTLDAYRQGVGVGTALIDELLRRARAASGRRVWLVTTNDNLSALGFYQRRGFRLVAVHPGAVDESRRLKPVIPEVGQEGIPLHDEVELAYDLGAGIPRGATRG